MTTNATPVFPYSVLLLYPDYLQDDGTQTYLAHVTAPNPAEAITLARLEAMNANGNESCEDGEDFAVLLVTAKHIDDVKP